MNKKYKDFISRQYDQDEYAYFVDMEKHYRYDYLSSWINDHPESKKAKWLEIGSGRGAFQDIVEDYTGMDIVEEVRKYYHKPYIVGDAQNLPFEDGSFDVIWTCSVYEMIPDIEKALHEIIRVVKKGGTILFSPAWHCRPWAADGYQVRPYSDFDLRGRIYKFVIPVMDLLIVRAAVMFPQRLMAYFRYSLNRNTPLIYKKLHPKYEENWTSDVDACNSLDQFMVIMWFQAHGMRCVSNNTFRRAFFSRNEELEFVKL